MEEHTYKYLEITGSSKVNSDEAIRNAILNSVEDYKKYALVRSYQ